MRLQAQELAAQLDTLAGWSHAPERGGVIRKEFRFGDFAQAFGFMAQVALHAERMNHHPEWFNVYDRVAVTLTTHDVDGVSAKDIALARIMDDAHAALTRAPA